MLCKNNVLKVFKLPKTLTAQLITYHCLNLSRCFYEEDLRHLLRNLIAPYANLVRSSHLRNDADLPFRPWWALKLNWFDVNKGTVRVSCSWYAIVAPCEIVATVWLKGIFSIAQRAQAKLCPLRSGEFAWRDMNKSVVRVSSSRNAWIASSKIVARICFNRIFSVVKLIDYESSLGWIFETFCLARTNALPGDEALAHQELHRAR